MGTDPIYLPGKMGSVPIFLDVMNLKLLAVKIRFGNYFFNHS
jgi:hypothetical protein